MTDNTFKSGRESSLHSAIKEWYRHEGDKVEAKVDDYIIDITRGNQLIEIQTANFSAIKTKLQHLLNKYKVCVVYPIPKEKWIIHKRANSEETFGRRKSPKKGCLTDIFDELIRIPNLLSNSNLSIEVLMVQEEETWRNNGKGSWRRKGASIEDRKLIRVLETRTFQNKTDYLNILPIDLPDPFSNKNLAEQMGISINQARRITYSLRKIGTITHIGNNRKQMLFTRSRARHRLDCPKH